MTSSCSSSPVEIIGYNEYLITQISLYLPVKSILCFRSVSKQWHSALNHPQFLLSHSHRAKKPMLFFKRACSLRIIEYMHLHGSRYNVGIADFNYLRYPNQHSLYLKSSSSGLLLIKSQQFWSNANNRYYVCNPSTRKFSELVLPDFITNSSTKVFAYLAFDPCTSPHYKVIFFNPHNDRVAISTYSSETKTLSEIIHTFERKGIYIYCHGVPNVVFFNGLLYWTDNSKLSSATLYNFDINDQESSINVFPKPSDKGKDFIMYFGEFGGHLNMILEDEIRPFGGVLNVYQLNKNNSSWVTKYKVDIESIAVDFPRIYIYDLDRLDDYLHSLICVVEEKEEEGAALVISIGNQLIAHNLVDNTTKKLCDVPFLTYNPQTDFLSWETGSFRCIYESLFEV